MSIITVTIPFPGGTATMTDSTAAAIVLQTGAFEKAFGSTGLTVPFSAINIMRVQADCLNNISSLMISMIAQQEKTTAAINGLKTAVAGISTHVASGVSIAEMNFTASTKHAAFQEQTTQDALKRADLPPTVVPPVDVVARIKENIGDLGMIKAQMWSANLVEENLAQATGYLSTVIGDFVKESFVGQAATAAQESATLWLKATFPSLFAKKVAAEAKSQLNATLVGIGTGLPPTGE